MVKPALCSEKSGILSFIEVYHCSKKAVYIKFSVHDVLSSDYTYDTHQIIHMIHIVYLILLKA